ncbi:ninjurin-B-like [Toxorhynchites rutilus septentrionalis]|uniref:ninjurin-B-like n=1 Tax=Toxorhynchites rutilus septentrionalis TaxID=329112 RepID=UPI0024796E7F|nr:ninjurin-B-like [Toxorhynchites rutilus septentrionalis]
MSVQERADAYRQHVEHHGNGAVHIFTGNEKQRKVLINPVIHDMNVDRVRAAYLDNEWYNSENTPNRQAQEDYDRTRSALEGGSSSYDVYRNVLENALNLAFLAANSNQLRLLTENQQEDTMYTASVGMVVMSLILQILIGVSMITISMNSDQRWRKLKVTASVCVVIVAVVNIVVLSLLNAVLLK